MSNSTRYKLILNSFGDRYFYEVNREIFDTEGAKARYDREFKDEFILEYTLYIFIGSDSGALIRHILSDEIPLGTRYVFVETDFLVSEVSILFPQNLAEKNIWITNAEQLHGLLSELEISEYIYLNSVKVKRSLSAEYGFIPEYRSLYWEIDSQVKDLAWGVTVRLGQEQFLRRQLENCADNTSSVSCLRNCISGATVVVLAGGPSLDEHLEWVLDNREKLYVLAVSRISQRLLEVGLEPDFIFSVDPQELSYQLSRDMLRFGPDTIFIYQYHAAPGLVSQWPHKKYYTGNRLPWESVLNPPKGKEFSGAGPTVTNHAIATAWWLGANRILLAGVDLCFTADGYTHAKGSRERAAGPTLDLTGLIVETNAGNLVSTSSDYLAAGRSLEVDAKGLAARGVELINFSDSALKMEGVSFAEPHTLYLQRKPSMAEQTDSVDMGSDLQALQDEIKQKLNELAELAELVDKAIAIHAAMYQGDSVDPDIKSELESIDDQMKVEYPELFGLAKTISIRNLMKMSNRIVEFELLDSVAIRQRLETYYGALRQGLQRLSQFIETGLAASQRRSLEYDQIIQNFSDASALVDSWIENGEAGRCRGREFERMPPQILTSANEAFQLELERDYAVQLTKKTKQRNLKALPARLQQLSDHQDIDGMEKLFQSLGGDDDYQPYMPLIKATFELIKGEQDAALVSLLPVVEDLGSPILEPALGHIFRLTSELGYQQAAMDALAGLAIINKRYLSLYADALAANNQLQDAIEHEIEYVHYFGVDTKVLSKLRHWYSLAQVEGADALLEELAQL